MSEAPARIQYEFASFRLDLQQRLLLSAVDGLPIPLSPKVFDTLLYFVERRGELLDKATLLKAIWPNIVVEENNLNQNISTLRRVLGESPGEHRFIVTEPGRGYRFVADVRTVATQPDAPKRGRAPDATLDTASAARPVAADAQRSIAVLPFVNLTRDIEKEYFSDGLAEELLHVLARVPGLKVPARTSSFAYKGRNTDVRQIAQDLDVTTVLEGSVRSAGELIRVAVQLVDGRTGYHLWSQSFERKFEDVFKLQDELAATIVRTLEVSVDDSTVAASLTPPTADIDAYHLYLQARALRGSGRYGRDEIPTAIELLERAVGRDPTFARAYSLLSLFYFVSVIYEFSGAESLGQAERHASHALALDPNLGEPQAVLAQVNALRGNWLAASPYFRSAIASEPNDPSLHNIFALFLGYAGQIRNALREALTAQELAVAVPVFAVSVGAWNSILGRDAEAVRFANLGLGLGYGRATIPLPLILSNAAYRAGRCGEAGKHMSDALRPNVLAAGGAQVVALIYDALGDSTKKPAAIEALRTLHARAAGPAAMGTSLMLVLTMHWCAMLGALDLAYEMADTGLTQLQRSGIIGGGWGGLWIPEMRPFRQDPRFQEFVTRLGLMEYWKQYGPPDDCELRGGKLICR